MSTGPRPRGQGAGLPRPEAGPAVKFLYGFLAFLALVVAALFLVPPALDWEQFRPEITEQLEDATGRTLEIEGAIEVSILPAPTMTVTDLRIAGAPGAASPDLVRVESLDLALALGPLLGGEIAVTSLELFEPVFELQRLADGRPSWLVEDAGAPSAEEAAAAADAEGDGLALARIDSATIRNGVIVYRHADGRPPERIEAIDASLSARSLDGPFRADGAFTVRGRTVAFELATGTIDAERVMPVSLDVKVGGERGSALFEGSVRGIDGTPSFEGTMRLQAADLGILLDALAIDRGALPAQPLAGAFSAKGALNASLDALAGRDLQIRLGECQASGRLSWQGGERPSLDADIELNRIDLDQYLPSAGGTEDEAQAAGGSDGGPAGATDTAALLQTIPQEIREAIPGDIAATVDFRIGTLTWREGFIRQARAQLSLDDGVLNVRQTSALLPGGADARLAGRLTKDGSGPWLASVAEIEANDLRAVLSWLAVDTGAVPADRLRHLSASADIAARGERLSASNLDIRIDTTRIAGRAALETAARPRLSATLQVDAVNLDAYLEAAGAVAPGAGSGEAAAPARAGAGADTALAGIDADIALAVDSLTYDGVRLSGLELDATLEDEALTLRRAQAADALGARVALTGSARSLWSAPAVDLMVEGEAESLSGVTALLDIDPALRAEPFGAIALQGSLEGGADALRIDLALETANAEVSLAGTVETPFGTPAAAPLRLGLQAEDAAALARTAGIVPVAVIERLGALTVEGEIRGDPDSLAIDLSAETAGATLEVEGRIMTPLDSPSYSLTVGAEHPRAEGLVEAVTGEALTSAALGPLSIAGTISGGSTAADIAGIDAAVGESRMTGGVFLRLDQSPPEIIADLQAETLDLAWLGAGRAAAGDGAAAGGQDDYLATLVEGAAPPPGRWSNDPIDYAFLDRLSGTLALGADALVLGDWRIEQAEVDLAQADGALTLRSLGGRLFDGVLAADGDFAGGPMPAGRVAFRLADADMTALVRALAGGDAVSGRATVKGEAALQGQSVRALIGSLAGRVSIAAREGAVEDVDLPAISRQIGVLATLDTLADVPGFVGLTERSLSQGRTAIHSLDGAIALEEGEARIETFAIVADGAVGDVEGFADLPAWQVDLTALFRLTDHPDAPPVGVRLEGPIDGPARHYLIEEMQNHLVQLGLLSLARAQEMPTITLRKGAKAEEGTELDTMLRKVFGDPEAADAPAQAQEGDAAEAADQATEQSRAGEADDEEKPAAPAPVEPPATPLKTEETEPAEVADGVEAPPEVEAEAAPEAAPADEAVQVEEETEAPLAVEAEAAPDAERADEAASAGEAEEPGGSEPTQEATETEAADGQGEGAAPPPADAPAPRPPPAPERNRGADLQDLVDDVLKALEE